VLGFVFPLDTFGKFHSIFVFNVDNVIAGQ